MDLIARIRNPALGLLLIFILSSCDSERVYEVNNDFASKYWHMDSAQRFEFIIPDVSRNYNLYLNLRNTSTYPFQNIYVQIELQDSVQKVVETILEDFQLFHRQTGKPFGSSGIGDIFDHQYLVLEDYKFPTSGKYSLTFTQMMRMDSLKELISIGARVEYYTPAD